MKKNIVEYLKMIQIISVEKLESYHDAENRPRPVSVSPVKELK